MANASRYDRFCDRAYAVMRAWLAPTLHNSQYEYRSALLDALGSGGRWLDLGCGHDFLPPWFGDEQRRLPIEKWQTVGVDLDADALRQHKGLTWRIHSDIERLPFRDQTFDLITANMVLEHVKNPPQLFAEVSRVLAAGGRFIVHTPNAFGYTTALARLFPKNLLAPLAQLLLERDPADVYPTYYHANSAPLLEQAAAGSQLSLAALAHIHSSPQLIRVPPLMALEMGLIRLLERPRFTRYRACIIATFTKPS